MKFKVKARGNLDSVWDADSDIATDGKGYGDYYGDAYSNAYQHYYSYDGYGSNPYWGYPSAYGVPIAPVQPGR